MNTFDYLSILSFIVLIFVSIFTVKIYIFFRLLSRDLKKGNLVEVIDKVIKNEKENKTSINQISKEITRLDEENLRHIQKIGFVKFNPFEEVGGDHSFSIALLDGKLTGFIITGLHTRERTRVYSKDIIKGKSRMVLSNEENKALQLALKS